MKANIFFFVTTIAVVIFTILLSVIAVYVIRILRNIKRASDRLEQGINALEDQADAISDRITNSFLFTLIFGKRAKRRAARETK